MRILICTGIYPPDIGGPATYSKLLFDELPKNGFEVKILSFGSVRRLPKIIRHLVYFLKALKMAFKTDIVYSQDVLSVGFPAMLAAKVLRKKFIIRVPGDYVWEQSVQRFGVKEGIDEFQGKKYGAVVEFLRGMQKFVVGSADLVIAPSVYFRNLVSKWVKNPGKVKTIYNGIELIEAPQAVKYVDKKKTILTAGRLVPWKGFDTLIELMKDMIGWQLIIVGDGPERNNLAEKIKALGLFDRVRITGAIPREDLLKLLNSSRIFVLNTSFESFSFQVVEAMNAGVPVITTNICNLAEIIDDGKEGILVEPNNTTQIFEAINKIESDEKFRKMIIENARKKAGQFSIENTINNLVRLLKTF